MAIFFINEYEISKSKKIESIAKATGENFKSNSKSINVDKTISDPTAGNENIAFATINVKDSNYSLAMPEYYISSKAIKNVLDGRNNTFKVSSYTNSSQIINLPVIQSSGIKVELDDNDVWS